MSKNRTKRTPGRKTSARGAARSARPSAPDPRPSTRDAERPAPDAERAAAPSPSKPEPAQPVRIAPSAPFPIVGIGASAGGLEAIEQFLRAVPERSGMAYVIVQHMEPTHRGAMVELLQRTTPMPVMEVHDEQKIDPDTVYVIPPNRDMTMLHGVLHLMPHTTSRGVHLPIDFFFRSLADDRQGAGIGVVLSGMGSDGTLGLRAIKEKAGAAFVQSLTSAKFDGMPRSAIDAGLADVVAPAEELAERIMAYCRHTPSAGGHPSDIDERHPTALEKVFVLLRAQSGNDFSMYKKSTVQRRIERRMGLHQIDKIGDYVRYLRENPRETELLFKELLIGVTSFFRDPDAWEHLRLHVLPELVAQRAKGGVIRAWVPACSTGEEAYSLAMVLTEVMEEAKSVRNLTFQIFATDLDREAIEKARQGCYPQNIAADVSPERLRRFFVLEDGQYRVRKEIRESVVFAPQNIITDPPFTKLEILSCRNLLIYLSAELQKKLIPLFHYSLNPNGVLFLGSAETIGTFSGLFSPYEPKSRIYRRLETAVGAPQIEFPSAFVSREGIGRDHDETIPEPSKLPPPNLQMLADRVIVQRFAPSAVLTTDKGDILYISNRTGKYLEPAVGKANMNVFAMAREGLRFELSSTFAAALKQEGAVFSRGIKVRTNGSASTIDLAIQKLTEPRELRGTVMIVMSETPSPGEHAASPPARRVPMNLRLAELQKELEQAREEAQTIREEMQTSQEELKSTNEELQSTNEELQSTNEELTTSKEEMQSMNEELQTVNHELQSKVDDLARSNNDMRNLLNSTDVATLFLDTELRVRRFTTQTTKIIKLIQSDAGRPITDIATDLDYPTLADDAREVLRTLVFHEKQVASRDGRWFTVRIMPYRTLENVIDGLVITFADSTAAKTLEATLREQASQLRQMNESLPNLVWACRPDGACDYLGQQWTAFTGIPEVEQLGYGWLDQVHADDRERVRDEWKAALKSGLPLATDVRIRSSEGSFRWFNARWVPIRDGQGAVVKWYGTGVDVNDLKLALIERERSTTALEKLVDWIGEPFLVLDRDLRIQRVNPAAESVLARRAADVTQRRLGEVIPGAAGSELESKIRESSRATTDARTSLRLADGADGGRAIAYDVLVQSSRDAITLLLKRVDGGATK